MHIKNAEVQKAIKLINLSIISFLISKKGVATIEEVEIFTDLNKVSINLVADLLKILEAEKHIRLNGSVISSSVADLKKVMRDEQINLPSCHGNPWSAEDYVTLAELAMNGIPIFNIAKKMNRTEQSVRMQASLLRKAYKLIEIVKNNPIVLEFVKTTSFPNPVVAKK
jgi:hypothetical protein